MLAQLMSRFRSFMAGRYGMDIFGLCLLALYFIGSLLVRLVLGLLLRGDARWAWWMTALQLLPYAFFGWALFRMLSKDIRARCAENVWVAERWSRLKAFFFRAKNRLSGGRPAARPGDDRKIFSCPGCGQQARVPRGKGKISITCPKCGKEFVRKT